MAGAIRIAILGDTRDIDRSLDRTAAKVSKSGATLQKAGNVAGKALAVGLAGAAAAAVSFAKGAGEDAAAAAKMAQTLRHAAGATDAQVASVEKWITAQGKALGVADDELRPAMARLTAVTKDVGEAQKLASQAMDISAATGKPLTTVTEALAKAQNGSVGGLSRLGVATKDAAGKTKTFAEIRKDLQATYGGAAANAADTEAGKAKILSVQYGELQETIGQKLLPIMASLTDAGLRAVDWIDRNQKLVAVLVGAFGGLLAVVWSISAAVKAYTAVQTALNVVMSANPIGLIIIAVAALVAGIVIAYKRSETFRDVVSGALAVVKSAAVGLWNGAKAALESVRSALGKIGDFATTMKQKITGGFSDVVTFIRGVPGKILALASKFRDAGASLMGKIIDGIKSAAGFIGNIASSIWNAVKKLVNSGIDKINAALEFKVKIPGAPDVHINPPNIPHLAQGGITTGPTLAMIGDNPGGREAVIPLDRYDLSGDSLLGTLQAILSELTAEGARNERRHADLLLESRRNAVRTGAEFGSQINKKAGQSRQKRR
ncbi:MAG TPA: hypothetical protein VGE38_08580 [Nocardioides sp.]|uniref:hypothetical protein n=1 Tax=Nocardioides sp. TaxID=35761 RepID=UPI002ED8C559